MVAAWFDVDEEVVERLRFFEEEEEDDADDDDEESLRLFEEEDDVEDEDGRADAGGADDVRWRRRRGTLSPLWEAGQLLPVLGSNIP